MGILRRFSRFASFAPQNDMFIELSTEPRKALTPSIAPLQIPLSQILGEGRG